LITNAVEMAPAEASPVAMRNQVNALIVYPLCAGVGRR
jgi:hypothetical protein